MEKMIKSFDGTNLFMKTDIPSDAKAILVMVHGLCEHQGRYDGMVKLLNENKIGTYRFDHRGHGRSEGTETHLTTFNELLDDTNILVDIALLENSHLPVFLLGHSMGGFTASLYGAKYKDKNLKGIITSGALVKDEFGLIANAPKGLDVLTPFPNELGDGVCSVREVVEWYAKDPYNKKSFTAGLCYSINDGVEWFKNTVSDFTFPILILHGEKDGIVSEKDSIFLFKNIASKDRQLKIYGEVLHEIFNEYIKEEVILDVVNWIHNRL